MSDLLASRFSPSAKTPRRGPGAAHLGLACVALLGVCPLASGCAKAAPAPAKAPSAATAPEGPIRRYEFQSLDEREVSYAALSGRATVLAFVASYGQDSLVQLRFVRKLLHEHAPRINVAAVFLEPITNRPLVRIYRDSARLDFPIAMANPETISGKGVFEGLNEVPSVVVLDNLGREVWRHKGLAAPKLIRKALLKAQRR